MGGSYSYSYSSPCSRPVIPEWQTTLQEAIKKGDREKLTEAYKSFFQDNGNGFIAEIAKTHGINQVEKIPKEFLEIEYEIKFDIQLKNGKGKEPTIENFLDVFDFPSPRNARFLKDPVHSVATGVNRFFGTDREEKLVVITKGDGIYLKEKGIIEKVDVGVPFQEIAIKRTEIRYPARQEDALNKIVEISSLDGVKYRGRIRKEKGDDFVFDTSDGRIYSFTITRAHLTLPGEEKESAIQRQVEIEYAGYIVLQLNFSVENRKI